MTAGRSTLSIFGRAFILPAGFLLRVFFLFFFEDDFGVFPGRLAFFFFFANFLSSSA